MHNIWHHTVKIVSVTCQWQVELDLPCFQMRSNGMPFKGYGTPATLLFELFYHVLELSALLMLAQAPGFGAVNVFLLNSSVARGKSSLLRTETQTFQSTKLRPMTFGTLKQPALCFCCSRVSVARRGCRSSRGCQSTATGSRGKTV